MVEADKDTTSIYKTFESTIPHIIVVVNPIDFKITYINRVQSGFSIDKVIGQNVSNFVMPTFIEVHNNTLKKVAAERQTHFVEFMGASGVQKSGSAWYKSTMAPIINDQNELTGILVVSEDISHEKEIAVELANKQEKLKSIINNTKDIILSIDRELNITEFNSVLASIVKNGTNQELKPGTPVFNIIHPSKHDHLRSIYDRVFQNNQVNDMEIFDYSNGTKIYFETSYNPINDSKGEVVGISIFSKDITQRIQNEEKLKKALIEKERMLQEIHHRLKNNLAIVSSILQLQELNMKSIEAQEALYQSRQRIKSTALLHELLYQGTSLEHLSLKTYLNRLFETIRSSIGIPEITLNIQGEDLVVNSIKAVPIGLLFNELMTNSFKHSFQKNKNGMIRIDIQRNKLSYTDSGKRFPENINFYSPKTTGLTLIHTFTEQLGGKIELVNQEQSSFYITLPTHEPEENTNS